MVAHRRTDVPTAWRDAPVLRIGRDHLHDPALLLDVVETLRSARLTRTPHAVLLDPALPWAQLLEPERERRPAWRLGPAHRLLRDELAFHLATLVDARSGTAVWWPRVRAVALGRPRSPTGAPTCGCPTGAPPGSTRGRGARSTAGPTPSDASTRRASSSRARSPSSATRRRATCLAPSSARRSSTAAARRGCSRPRARARHGCSPRGCDISSTTEECSRGSSPRSPTTRAARELVERTGDVVTDGVRPRIRTVHALGLAICTAVLGRRPVVLDPTATVAALREASASDDGPRIGAPGGPTVDAVLAALTDVRLGLRDPADVEAARGDVPGFAALVPRYRALLHARGWLDFDEQVQLAIALLLADPALRVRVQRATTHLLVDEVQDLTPAFMLLVRLLVGPAQQLFAVGDDDQTIYGYAGATPHGLVDLPDAYRGMATYVLSVNHRCPPAVVRAASALLAHNTVRVAKTVRPAPRDDGEDEAAALEVLDAPAGGATRRTVERVRGLLADGDPDDVVVLARVGASLIAPQVALDLDRVPLRPHVGPEVLARSGLRTALAYLRIAVRPDRIAPADLDDTLRRPARRLTGMVGAGGRTTSLAALARRMTAVDVEHRGSLRRYVEDLALLATLAREGADSGRLLDVVRTTIGLGATLDALDRRRVRPEGSSHGDDLDALLDLASIEPDPDALPRRLVEHLQAAGRARDAHDHAGRVTLSTVHRVKGREWDTVVLVGMRAGLIPHRLCDDVEEERRVLHVAVTRAQRRLVIFSDPGRPSPLVPELLGTLRTEHEASADETAVLEALRTWRRARADAQRVPAFLIAHDRTLTDLARRRPQDLRALRACHGIGPARLARYDDELLTVLRTGPPEDGGPRLP